MSLFACWSFSKVASPLDFRTEAGLNRRSPQTKLNRDSKTLQSYQSDDTSERLVSENEYIQKIHLTSKYTWPTNHSPFFFLFFSFLAAAVAVVSPEICLVSHSSSAEKSFFLRLLNLSICLSPSLPLACCNLRQSKSRTVLVLWPSCPLTGRELQRQKKKKRVTQLLVSRCSKPRKFAHRTVTVNR